MKGIEDSNILQEAESAQVPLNGSDMMFVTWFASGGHGDGGFSTHQFAKPDMRWIDVVRKSHPGCSVAYVLDQDTQLESYEGLDVHRIDVDKTKFGRYNSYTSVCLAVVKHASYNAIYSALSSKSAYYYACFSCRVVLVHSVKG